MNLDVPLGHFYSPIVDTDELTHIYDNSLVDDFIIPKSIASQSDDEQLNLIRSKLIELKAGVFCDTKEKRQRYYLGNNSFSYFDAFVYYVFLEEYKPDKVVEVGSGFSSALLLDYNERVRGGEIECLFIEPYPDRFKELTNGFEINYTLISDKVQAVDLAHYRSLKAGDILFIDSSHVSKTGSDLNHIVFNILPILSPGVIIHFHDIFYPFEYPKKWIFEKRRSWNEIYFLKSFLMYNNRFKVLFFNSYIQKKYTSFFEKELPDMLKTNGSSLWLEVQRDGM